MFVHQHALRYLLRPEHYCTQRQHDLELEQLFLPAWHFIAAKSELPRDGDFLTLELFGRPLLLEIRVAVFWRLKISVRIGTAC